MSVDTKPHAVCVPLPLQGHINPLLKVAKLLHSKGFHITFVNTQFVHERILETMGPNSLDGMADFCFETLPIDHPPSNHANLSENLMSFRVHVHQNFLATFQNLLMKLNKNAASSNAPPVTFIIADGFLGSAVTAVEELSVPAVFFWNVSAAGLMSYFQFCQLMTKRVTHVQGEHNGTDEGLNVIKEWIPGMKAMTTSEVSSALQRTDLIGHVMDFCDGELQRASKASAHIFNTFEALEAEMLKNLSSKFSRVYSIGPLDLLLNNIPNDPYKSIKCSLLKEGSDCIQWLNSKEPNSVVYASFGSLMVTSSDKLVELAWGLANSKYHFLWIIRTDLVMGESAILPHEFLLETKEKGFIASWCPQEQVLSHPAIAAFITHSGWNSTIESMSCGVPMICWPFFGEHFITSRNSCHKWGIGMELNDDFTKDNIEKLLRELVEGEKGKMMKKKAIEWKHMAEEATSSAGSSALNFDKLVSEVLLAKH